MTTLRFTIGKAFPASDSVARFITVLAMMSNDWLRLMAAMLEIEDYHKDAEGLRIMSFRQQAALHHEAAEFIETRASGSRRSSGSSTAWRSPRRTPASRSSAASTRSPSTTSATGWPITAT
jgi:hypothetical protein